MPADAIEFPIVAAKGLAVYVPLTLLVTLIECGAFRVLLGVPPAKTFRRVLTANVVSALVGGIMALFDHPILYAVGVLDSIPEFISGYRWAVLILIVGYFAKSVIVEGWIVASRGFAAALERTRPNVIKTVAVANLASYCVLGPLYFFATRPTFGGVRAEMTTAWTANAGQTAYFINTEDGFIKRIRLDGTGKTTLVPYPAADFLMAGDPPVFAYRGRDGCLYVYGIDDSAPVRVWTTDERFLMHSVSLAPDGQRVAFAREAAADVERANHYSLTVFDLATRGSSAAVENRERQSFFTPVVSWSSDGSAIFVQEAINGIAVFAGESPWTVRTDRLSRPPAPNQLVRNFVRSARSEYGGGDDWGILLWEDTKDGYQVRCWRGLGAHLDVSLENQLIWNVPNDYGLLKIGFIAPRAPSFLPNALEVLLEWWGQLYVLDIKDRRLGLLTGGHHYILPSPRFRVHFDWVNIRGSQPSSQ